MHGKLVENKCLLFVMEIESVIRFCGISLFDWMKIERERETEKKT